MAPKARHDTPVRTTIYLDRERHKRLKLAVIERDDGSVSAVIERLIDGYLSTSKPARGMADDRGTGEERIARGPRRRKRAKPGQ